MQRYKASQLKKKDSGHAPRIFWQGGRRGGGEDYFKVLLWKKTPMLPLPDKGGLLYHEINTNWLHLRIGYPFAQIRQPHSPLEIEHNTTLQVE